MKIQPLADRVLVMCEGRITGEVEAGASQETIMSFAHQRQEQPAV